jgi:hypothetical protein
MIARRLHARTRCSGEVRTGGGGGEENDEAGRLLRRRPPAAAVPVLRASKVLGWPTRCKLARVLRWGYSHKRLKLAQLLGQLGVFLTRPAARRWRSSRSSPPRSAGPTPAGAASPAAPAPAERTLRTWPSSAFATAHPPSAWPSHLVAHYRMCAARNLGSSVAALKTQLLWRRRRRGHGRARAPRCDRNR